MLDELIKLKYDFTECDANFKKNLIYSQSTVVKRERLSEVEPYRRITIENESTKSTWIAIPSNHKEFVLTPIGKIVHQAINVLELQPFVCQSDKTFEIPKLKQLQEEICAGILSWLVPKTIPIHNSSLKGGFKLGSIWAAGHANLVPENVNGGIFQFFPLKSFTEVITGSPWTKQLGEKWNYIGQLTQEALCRLSITETAWRSYLKGSVQIANEFILRRNPIKDNVLFSDAEQQIYATQYKSSLEKLHTFQETNSHSPTLPVEGQNDRTKIAGAITKFWKQVLDFQKVFKPLKTNADAAISERIGLWLGPKREHEKNRKKPKNIRLNEINQTERFVRAFQPGTAFRFKIFVPGTTTDRNGKSLSVEVLIQNASADIDAYCTIIKQAGVPANLVDLSHSWLTEAMIRLYS
jgi:hypothetical protein